MKRMVLKRRFRLIPKDISPVSVALYLVVMPPFFLVMSTLLVIYVLPQKSVNIRDPQVKGAATESTSTISPNITEGIDTWKTFVSKKWQFSFKYPSIFEHQETLFGNSSGKQIEVSIRDVLGQGNSVPYMEVFIMKGENLKEMQKVILENNCTSEVIYSEKVVSGVTYTKAQLSLNESCDNSLQKKVAYGFYIDEDEELLFMIRNIDLGIDTFEKVIETVTFSG